MFGLGHGRFQQPIRQPRPGLEGLRYYSFADSDDESLAEYHRAQALQMGNGKTTTRVKKDERTPTKKVKRDHLKDVKVRNE